ncbi:hypothetical protein [Evansella tamaricis]|uniref:Uncharacterized protein n=1 Tax=Evansella tamaricis TaxID=2069301 RepID=A0ABS6J9V4_9BACI|nr:hypothetical protein [Evansella tamaricis]MBU9710466.1 hypothetical protein [Evansella tamaricis]
MKKLKNEFFQEQKQISPMEEFAKEYNPQSTENAMDSIQETYETLSPEDTRKKNQKS